jgi:hypothetical protein
VDSANGLPELNNKMKLYFHPFRFFVLYHLEKHLRVEFTPVQPIINSKGFERVLQMEVESIQRSTSNAQFINNLTLWNQTVDLCIALEPYFYEVLFGVVKYSPRIGYEGYKKEISQHWEEVEPVLRDIGLDQLEKMRSDLCVSAEMLDRNKEIHTLLRLTRGEKRFLNTKGNLGGAMVLLTMAELLRRGCEKAFSVQLKEEDELGFGMWFPGAKMQIYGTDRITDINNTTKTQWLRVFGLSSGLRLKWYVEGETEYYALDSVLGEFGPIEFVNLRGKVVQKGIIAFRENLLNDIKASLYSFISLDNDRSDFLRAVQKAAESDEICGMFFVSDPDFEFQNFSLSELEEILYSYCQDNTPGEILDRNEFHNAIKDVKNAEQLLAAAKKYTKNPYIGKGAEWGRRLMLYAQNNLDMDDNDGTKIERPIISAVGSAVRSCSSNYLVTKQEYKTDPITGKFAKREI